MELLQAPDKTPGWACQTNRSRASRSHPPAVMKFLIRSAVAAVLLAVCQAQVPQLINYQGRVAVQGVNFDGTGQFKFALVDATGTIVYWANSPDTAPPDGAPDNPVSLTVTKGLYSVLLGDATLPNMAVMPATVFANPDVRLRVWFNDGTHGFQLLSPDQRIAAVGYAMMAGNAQTVSDGAITAAKIAAGAVGSTQLASGAVQSGNIATGAVGSAQLAAGALAAPVSITGTVQAASANASYVATSASPTAIQLPGSAAVGAVVQITGVGAGGWSAYSPGTWTPRESNRAWTSITCSSDATKLAATVYNGQIHTSSDAGGTWTARESNRSWQSVASSADGTKLIAAATGGFLYSSTDSGATWTQRGLSRGWQAVASSSDGTKLVAVISGGPIYVSSDSGLTWNSRASTRSWQSVCSSADGTKLAAAVYGGQIYLSSDSGLNWTARESSRNWSAIACSADGTKLVGTVENGRIYTSLDSGLNWTARESIRSWQTVASSADGMKLAAAENGGKVYLSTDSGTSWSAEESNRAWWGIASSADGSKLAAVEYSGRIYLSSGGVLVASGSQGTTTTLQYLGNGQWAPVGQNQIAAGSVGASQIVSGAVQSGHIASGAVGSTQIASGSVQSGNIASGAIQSGNIAGGAVGGPQIATGAVGATHIAAGAITADKVPTGQVVKSINGFRDQVSISAGDHVVVNESGNGLEIGTSGLWSQSGNPGGLTRFLGTTDSTSLVLKANGTTGLRISPSGETPNIIGGYSGNQVPAGVDNATIAGGGWASNVNQVTGNGGAVGGGGRNTAGVSAVVGGGYGNQATGDTSSILGGMSNVAAGSCASIPGGLQNSAAGDFSLAAGRRAKALHSGAFVWADSVDADFSSAQNGQFLIRAAGGVGINTPNTSGALTIKQTGAGNFLTLQNQASILANIDASGNINTIGNVNASNTPAIQWSQNYIPGYPDFVGQGAYTLEEITMNLESDGYLMLFAFVNLWVKSTDANGLPVPVSRRLKLDDFTNGDPATLVVESLHIATDVTNDSIHWVLPVSAGNRKIRFVLDASMSEGIQIRIKTHNLTAIFIPKRAN